MGEASCAESGHRSQRGGQAPTSRGQRRRSLRRYRSREKARRAGSKSCLSTRGSVYQVAQARPMRSLVRPEVCLPSEESPTGSSLPASRAEKDGATPQSWIIGADDVRRRDPGPDVGRIEAGSVRWAAACLAVTCTERSLGRLFHDCLTVRNRVGGGHSKDTGQRSRVRLIRRTGEWSDWPICISRPASRDSANAVPAGRAASSCSTTNAIRAT